MGNVFAHTSKIGYYELRESSVWWDRYRSSWAPITSSFVRCSSYKSPLVKSDKIHATSYSRKVCRIDSITGPHYFYNDGTRERKGSLAMSDSSGLTMAGSPFGTFRHGPSVNVPTWMTDKVVQDAIIELHEFRANILEDLGQARQTLGTLWGILRSIVDLYLIATRGDKRALRRLAKRYGSNIPQRLSNIWLMYFYGIKPLISTMEAVSQSYQPIKKTRKVVKTQKISLDPAGAIGQGPPAWTVSSSGTAEAGARCGLAVRVNLDSDVRYFRTLGLSGNSINDALVTAWALVPYSFVVDWILPVERFLRTRSWGSGLDYQSGYIDRKIEATTTHTLLTPVTASGQRARASVRVLFFERQAYNTSVPLSGLSIKLSLTSTQAFNALALIAQRR